MTAYGNVHSDDYASWARSSLELAGEVNTPAEAHRLIAESQVYATLAVAAATLEASRTVYPANHPLAQETT